MRAWPPVVVSGEPKVTPIFMRSWLMNTTAVSELAAAAVSLRSAWLISRACRPTWVSPISPSSSDFGTSAATESITTRSMPSDRTSVSVISNACSPESGCETSRDEMSTPSRLA